ncbi:MAG: FAD-dependent oxidoreductase [Candidatus Latescibacterota bacterium]|nr:MAG: FAD-dependent oxidoreductase [Candidatus Latescibacterota bacterium]
MRTITEPSREVPVLAEADVVVCGGGPGGFPAAVAAARHGAKTILIERYGFMGGLATAGLVAPILGHTAHESDTPIVQGILKEVTERMHALGCAPSWEESLREWGIRFDAEALKVVIDEMCREAGVEVLLHTLVVDVVKEGDSIAAVMVENKSGRQAVVGKVFVDATGDADVAYRAGAPTTHGRAFDSRNQAMGSFFHLAGFGYPDTKRVKELHKLIRDRLREGRFRFYNEGFLNRNAYHTDHTSANMTRVGGDPTSVRDLTRAEMEVRREVWKLVRYLREEVRGFEDCYVQQTSFQVGPRESRQVVGPYALTGDDIRRGAKFEDAIARGSWWIDIHCPLGRTYPVHLCTAECPEGNSCPYWISQHESMLSMEELFPPKGDWYDIPYRCLLSVAVPNLLASGRCISATYEGMAGARVMGTCIAVGQAAGTAAALAVAEGVRPGDVDVSRLREVLREDGQLV